MSRWFLLMLLVLLNACGNQDSEQMQITLPGSLLLTETHGDDGLAWGIEACDGCHAMTVIHQGASKAIRDRVREKGFETCTGCHGNNGTSAVRQCLICHNDTDLPGVPFLDGGHAHGFSQPQDSSLSDADCLVCHHYSDMDGRFDLNLDLTLFPDASGRSTEYQAEADFCLRCHNRDHQQPGYEIEGDSYADPLVALEDDYRYIDYHGWRDGTGEGTYRGLRPDYRYPQLVACSDCHALHGTSNEKLIIDNSLKGAKLLSGEPFLSNVYHVEVNQQGDYSQLCVLCHEMTSLVDEGDIDTGNRLSGVHLVGQDCRPCHTHGEASQVGL
jgi:cytochrome c553